MRSGKYNARRTQVDGIWFDSKREAKRYEDLKLMERAGEIRELELQPVYLLHARGTLVGAYRADFRYWDICRKRRVVEDVKGVRTPLYRWKKKHLLAEYGIEICEV